MNYRLPIYHVKFVQATAQALFQYHCTHSNHGSYRASVWIGMSLFLRACRSSTICNSEGLLVSIDVGRSFTSQIWSGGIEYTRCCLHPCLIGHAVPSSKTLQDQIAHRDHLFFREDEGHAENGASYHEADAALWME